MRVIAGTFRGRSLEAPPGAGTRPITDRVKETLFNILGHRLAVPGQLPDVHVLDLFAGPGSLGIEALSRGARTCTFVERDREALRCLRQNIQHLDLQEVCTLLTDNAWTLRPQQLAAGFGLIFVDPPYRDAQDPRRVLDLLERLAPSLAPGGLIVFRCSTRAPALPPGGLGALRPVDERTVGRMRLVFLARRAKTVAIVGASADRSKYGNKAVRAYLRQGWDVYPVNPRGGQIEGRPVYPSLAEIPVKLDRVSLYLPPVLGLALLPDIVAVRPAEFFVNPGAESEALLAAARGLGLDPIQACSILAIDEAPEDFDA